MTQMTSSADKVALVQTALMLPIMLISMPAGAIADMYDRRIVALISLSIALSGATALSVLAWLGLVTPQILLALLLHRRQRHGAVRTGLAILGQRTGADGNAALRRGAERHQLQYRAQFRSRDRRHRRRHRRRGRGVRRQCGAVSSAAGRAVSLAPRRAQPSRLPRERLNRAIVSGVRYIANSPSIRIVLARTLVTGVIGGSVSALMPLVARDLLHGGAQTYGIMLGAFGMGAVIGALNIAEVRKRMTGEAAVRACALSMGGAIAAVALSREPVLTAAALVVAGAAWMLAVALFNIGVQLSAPRWVAGRSLAAFQAAICRRHRDRKLGLGTADRRRRGRNRAIGFGAPDVRSRRCSACGCGCRRVGARNEDAEVLADPEVQLSLTGRSGPLVVEIEYRVAQDNARAFHNVMQEVQLSSASATAPMAGRSRATSPIPNCGPSAIIARPGSITCASATAHAIRARAASARHRFSSRPRSGSRPPHAGAAVRIGALEGRDSRPRRPRGLAGGTTAAGSST